MMGEALICRRGSSDGGTEQATYAHACAVLSGQAEDASLTEITAIRAALDNFVDKLAAAAVPKELNENIAAFRVWTQAKYMQAGVYRSYQNGVFKLLSIHDATGNPNQNPLRTPSYWQRVHGTSRESAWDWLDPEVSHRPYQNGEWVVHKKTYYESKVDNNKTEPGTEGSNWEEKT